MSDKMPILSVLIPIFNFEVEGLIDRLGQESAHYPTEIEIICADDCSQNDFRTTNQKICDRYPVTYIQLDHNLGRSKIRNFLAQQAKGKYLLFIDCDSAIPQEGFLARYLQTAQPNQIIYGGRIYEDQMPDDTRKRFHWKYGHRVEAPNLERRKEMGHTAFQSNNFLVPKALFSDLRFDESIDGYGYEDLKLGQIFFEKGIPITHIDNPVVHIGLEDQKDFFRKTDNAIRNLAKLRSSAEPIDTRLTTLIDRLRKMRIEPLCSRIAPAMEGLFKALLNATNPPIWVFQGWKFWLYLDLLQEEEKKRTDQ